MFASLKLFLIFLGLIIRFTTISFSQTSTDSCMINILVIPKGNDGDSKRELIKLVKGTVDTLAMNDSIRYRKFIYRVICPGKMRSFFEREAASGYILANLLDDVIDKAQRPEDIVQFISQSINSAKQSIERRSQIFIIFTDIEANSLNSNGVARRLDSLNSENKKAADFLLFDVVVLNDIFSYGKDDQGRNILEVDCDSYKTWNMLVNNRGVVYHSYSLEGYKNFASRTRNCFNTYSTSKLIKAILAHSQKYRPSLPETKTNPPIDSTAKKESTQSKNPDTTVISLPANFMKDLNTIIKNLTDKSPQPTIPIVETKRIEPELDYNFPNEVLYRFPEGGSVGIRAEGNRVFINTNNMMNEYNVKIEQYKSSGELEAIIKPIGRASRKDSVPLPFVNTTQLTKVSIIDPKTNMEVTNNVFVQTTIITESESGFERAWKDFAGTIGTSFGWVVSVVIMGLLMMIKKFRTIVTPVIKWGKKLINDGK